MLGTKDTSGTRGKLQEDSMPDIYKSANRYNRRLYMLELNGQSLEIVEKCYRDDTIGTTGGAFECYNKDCLSVEVYL